MLGVFSKLDVSFHTVHCFSKTEPVKNISCRRKPKSWVTAEMRVHLFVLRASLNQRNSIIEESQKSGGTLGYQMGRVDMCGLYRVCFGALCP